MALLFKSLKQDLVSLFIVFNGLANPSIPLEYMFSLVVRIYPTLKAAIDTTIKKIGSIIAGKNIILTLFTTFMTPVPSCCFWYFYYIIGKWEKEYLKKVL